MSYRQLLKATNKYVNNQKFKIYLKQFYRQNNKNYVKEETIKAWVNLLSFLNNKRAQKLSNKKIQDKVNLSSLFIKHPIWNLSTQEYRDVISNNDFQNAYNIYMVCQIYYLWSQKKVFGKKVAKNLQEVEALLKQKKKFSIDQSQKISFI